MAKCTCCGIEQDKKLMESYFVGRGMVYICWKRYREQSDKICNERYERAKKYIKNNKEI